MGHTHSPPLKHCDPVITSTGSGQMTYSVQSHSSKPHERHTDLSIAIIMRNTGWHRPGQYQQNGKMNSYLPSLSEPEIAIKLRHTAAKNLLKHSSYIPEPSASPQPRLM